ncbi:DUF3293 domain-containing protein [Flavobacterium aciduliphilum]|uniref:Uncharacterized protein DUF3293 n=1 Tax=Flavobacterium aciduliphilum TaxID=1101402 RepID=A0A328YK61_9FLAO|nr:DUF3293 domain-containing protein [Flavobacterium aciduliphilum]RAR73694.1 uncharacterized protein DUF3293 [Flavobacterium aciduliphilum]
MISKELLLGYQSTCYSILNPKIDIYLTKDNEALHSFLKEHHFNSWCFITAWNPFSNALSLEDNQRLNSLLEQDLTNYTVFAGEGKDTLGDWPPEISFFVGGITKEAAIYLGKKYEQNAIVYGEINGLAELILLAE